MKRTGRLRIYESRPGLFVVVEGADASGKSTLVKRLVHHYGRSGQKVRLVREPGGTKLSEKVRKLLLDVRQDISARAELFLYLAARAQLSDDVIIPALDKGEMVIADRFSLSTFAYQSAGRGLELSMVAASDSYARGELSPDLTIVLTVSAAEAQRRLESMAKSPDRIEAESREFHNRVRAFYSRWPKLRAGYVLIDSAEGTDAVFHEACRKIDRTVRRRMEQ